MLLRRIILDSLKMAPLRRNMYEFLFITVLRMLPSVLCLLADISEHLDHFGQEDETDKVFRNVGHEYNTLGKR